MAFLNPPEPYSPIFLPGFDKKEYANWPAEDDVEVVDGGTEVEDVKIGKELKAKANAARTEGDL